MPELRPGHEVKMREGVWKDKPLHEESFRERREELGKRGVTNSSRPPDRMPARTGGGVIDAKRATVE